MPITRIVNWFSIGGLFTLTYQSSTMPWHCNSNIELVIFVHRRWLLFKWNVNVHSWIEKSRHKLTTFVSTFGEMWRSILHIQNTLNEQRTIIDADMWQKWNEANYIQEKAQRNEQILAHVALVSFRICDASYRLCAFYSYLFTEAVAIFQHNYIIPVMCDEFFRQFC